MKVLTGITRKGSMGMGARRNPTPHNPLKFQNKMHLEVIGPNEHGMIVTKAVRDHEGNLMTTQGLDWMVSNIGAGTPAAMAWNLVSVGVIGTGNTAPTSVQTALANATASLAWGAAAITGGRSGAMSLSYGMSFDAAGAYNPCEVGLFWSNVSTASMLCRQTFATITKASADSVRITYSIIGSTA